MIPTANQVREWQAPSVDKFLGRCEKKWHLIMDSVVKSLTQDQKKVSVDIMGETPEILNEAIEIFNEKELGFRYEYELFDEPTDNGWVTGKFWFMWDEVE